MNVSDVHKHKGQFDAAYSPLEILDLQRVKFPLEEIEKFDWRRGRWADAYYCYHYRRFTCHTLEKLGLEEKQKVLVIGCGFGFDEKNIGTLFRDVDMWSIDISEVMVKLAVGSGAPGRFAVALAEHLPFPDNSFDRVLSREVIEHVIDPSAMLSEVRRVLKPGGRAVITTENEESFGPTNFFESHVAGRLAKIFGYTIPDSPVKDEAPTLAEMKRMIHEAGLLLETHFYDGALYKYLREISFLFRKKMSDLAHYFSCLENGNKLAYGFCDQVKYVLTKRHEKVNGAEGGAVSYVCPLCKATMTIDGCMYVCSMCGEEFHETSGVPCFLPKGRSVEGQPIERNEPSLRIRKPSNVLFGLIKRVLRVPYTVCYLAAAFTCTLFVEKNHSRSSKHLSRGSAYRKYLAGIKE